ncbi:threonine--tRNA ligase [Patescibacteria group bacterium]
MDDKKLDQARHSAAHMLAAAVLELYPKSKIAIGPTVDDGFYYDIEFPEDVVISDRELPKIEKRMKRLIKQNIDFVEKKVDAKEAKKLIKSSPYKKELIEELEKEGQEIKIYESGDFVDLCEGGHVKNSKEIPIDGLKLHRVAGAYWRGDEKNKMLTRIYGLLFATKKELDDYLELLEQAKLRDHRKLGKELDLFLFSDLVGKGLPLFTERGATIRRELERAVVDEERRRGYEHVITPDLASVELYKTSGHYPYYKDTMYAPITVDDEEIILRPMSCPHHFMLYKSRPHSYKELPLRMAELVKLYRYEKSGELSGLMRVRGFCLADSHIFVTQDQAGDEIKEVIELIEYFASVFGLEKGKDYLYRLSLGDREDEKKYYKNDEMWDLGEGVLRKVLQDMDAPFYEAEKEGAFYGPKIDIQMKNVLGKEDTAFTVQYDFCLPERFDLKYIDAAGKEKQPIVIHRSSIGAIERTMAFLIEHYAGEFPLWLSPEHVAIISVGENHKEYCYELAKELEEKGLRVKVDDSDETVGKKISKAVKMKYPYMLVIGDKEMGSKKLMVRIRGQKDLKEIDKSKFISQTVKLIEKKSLDLE